MQKQRKLNQLLITRKEVNTMNIIKEYKKANAIVASLLVTLLVIIVIFSIMGIYINKMYTIKSLNDYYDKQITQQLKENNKSK